MGVNDYRTSPDKLFGFNPNQISAYYGGACPTFFLLSLSCFNPNQISAYYGGNNASVQSSSGQSMFQSESNLGLLWGYDGPATIWGDCSKFQSESNLGLLWGLMRNGKVNTVIFVSIRIKSRLIMGDVVVEPEPEPVVEFQSESNLGLLWGNK